MQDNFELQTGIFEDNLLSVKIDTDERINSLFNTDVEKIQLTDYTIPKVASSDDIVLYKNNGSSNITIDNAERLTHSKDPDIRKKAVDFLYSKKAEDPIVKNKIGYTNIVEAQEGQDKFTNSNFLNHNKYGFNPYISVAENENFYKENVWDNYSMVGKAWRNIGTFAGRTLSKLATGLVGTVGDIMSVAWNAPQEVGSWVTGKEHNFWADVSNNVLARKMEELDSSVKDFVLPTYKSLDYDKKGAFSKLGDPYFWKNDMADGVGFLLQFAVPGAGFGKLAQLGKVGKAGKLGKLMATPTSKLVSNITGGDNIGAASAWMFNTTMESIAETKEGFHKTVDELVKKGFSKEEAEKEASENAPSQFAMNMGILSISSSFENRWFQKLAGNYTPSAKFAVNDAGDAVFKNPKTKLGKFLAENTWGQRLSFYGENVGKAILTEGYWEENAQLAAARVSTDGYTRKLEDNTEEYEKSGNFFKQLIKQTYDASTLFGGTGDKEAADSIMAGSVIGALGGVAFSKLGTINNKDEDGNLTGRFEGVRRMEMRELSSRVAKINNIKSSWLSLSSFDKDVYNVDESGNKTINKDKINEKIEELNTKLAVVDKRYKDFLTIENLEDPKERKILHGNLFADYVLAHYYNNTHESLIERLDNWKNKTPQELELFGVTKDMNLDVNEMGQKARNLIELKDTIENIKYKNTKDSALDFEQKTRDLKNKVFQHTVNAESFRELSELYKSKSDELIPFDKNDKAYNYNMLQSENMILNHNLNNAKTKEEKDALKSQIQNIEEQLSITKELLPDYKEHEGTGFLFKSSSNLDKTLSSLGSKLPEYLINYNLYMSNKIDSNISLQFAKNYSNPYTGLEFYDKQVEMAAKKVDEVNADNAIKESIQKVEESLKPQVTDLNNGKFEVKENDGTTTVVEAESLPEAKQKAEEIVEEKEKVKNGDDLVLTKVEAIETDTENIKNLITELNDKVQALRNEKQEIEKELALIEEAKNLKISQPANQEEKEFIEEILPIATETVLTATEQEILDEVIEENKGDLSKEGFLSEQLQNEFEGKESDLKGTTEKLSLFRRIIKKIAAFIAGLSIIWLVSSTASPISDYLNRNDIISREKTTFVMDITKTPQMLTSNSFNARQKQLLLNIIKTAESKNQNYASYNDYSSGYDGVQFDKTSVNTKLGDNSDETIIKRTLGQFQFYKVGNNYIISDRYNFNDAGIKSFGERWNYVIDGLKDSTLNNYGKIRRIGTLLGSPEGKGADVKIVVKDNTLPVAAIGASFLLLGSIRRKREDGEDITDDEIQSLKDRINEIDREIEKITKDYNERINQLREEEKKKLETKVSEEQANIVYDDEVIDDGNDVTDEKSDVYQIYERNEYKPVLWATSLNTSKWDTIDLEDKDENGNKISEQLRDVPYSSVLRSFITDIIPSLTENSSLKFFIENDTYTELYNPPFNNENTEGFIPSGEVITVYKDGKPVKVKDIFPDLYKEMGNLPIVFPFNKQDFSERQDAISIYLKNYNKLNKDNPITRDDVIKFFKNEYDENQKVRVLAKKGIKTEVTINYFNTGFIPSVMKNEKMVYDTVENRISNDFKFKVSKEGIVYANFGKGKGEIPISMKKAKDNEQLILNIDKILKTTFATEQEAKDVRNQYLNVLFNTNKKSKFSIYPDAEGFKIVYRSIKSNLPDDQINENDILPSKDYENLYINVNKKALEKGMNVYDSSDNSFSFIEADEYIEFLKDNANTHFKKITDKNGELKMFPINTYFSFSIVKNEIPVKENAKSIEEKIQSLINNGKLTEQESQKIQTGLNDILAKQEILKNDYEKLSELAKRITVAAEKQMEKVEPEKELTVAEKKKALLKKQKVDLKEVLSEVNKPKSFNFKDLKEIETDIDGNKYTISLEDGNITRAGLSGKVKINPDTTKYGNILLNLAELNPFKNTSGFIEGIYTQELEVEREGEIFKYKAVGLPSLSGKEIFLDENNAGVMKEDILGILTENGKKQFENFENRYC